LALAVEGKAVLRRGIVEQGICVGLVRFDFARDLQGLEIKNDHLLQLPIRDKSLPKRLDYHDSVAAYQATDRTHHRVVIGVEYNDFRAVRYINAARGGIHRDVVEILAASRRRGQWNFFEQVVTDCRRTRQRVSAEQQK